MLKIIDSTYAKGELEQLAANATQMNAEERIQLLRILQDFEDLFDGTLGDWDTDTINIELKPYYKTFNCKKYYQVPIFNKETFCKELQRLVKIGVLAPVQ